MIRRNRKVLAAGVAMLALLALVSPERRASIEIIAQRSDDLHPQKMQAALDLGVVAFSLLVTWSQRLRY